MLRRRPLHHASHGPPPHRCATGRIDGSLRPLRRDRLVGREGEAAQGVSPSPSRGRGRRPPGWSAPDHVWSRTEVLEWLLAEAAAGADLVRLRLQLRAADRRARRISSGGEGRPVDARGNSGPMSKAAATTRISAPRASSNRPTAAISISESPMARRRASCISASATPGSTLQGGRKTASAYDAIGAAQVAKASFSGHAAAPPPGRPGRGLADGRIAGTGQRGRRNLHPNLSRRAGLSGTKLRSGAELDRALAGLGSRPAAAPLRAERPPDRRARHRRRNAGASGRGAAGLRSGRADSGAGPDRRLDVRDIVDRLHLPG